MATNGHNIFPYIFYTISTGKKILLNIMPFHWNGRIGLIVSSIRLQYQQPLLGMVSNCLSHWIRGINAHSLSLYISFLKKKKRKIWLPLKHEYGNISPPCTAVSFLHRPITYIIYLFIVYIFCCLIYLNRM